MSRKIILQGHIKTNRNIYLSLWLFLKLVVYMMPIDECGEGGKIFQSREELPSYVLLFPIKKTSPTHAQHTTHTHTHI